MSPLIHPTDTPEDLLDRAGCLCDFMAEVLPGWLDNPSLAPPSSEGVNGMVLIAGMVAELIREAGRRMPSSRLAA